MRMCAAKVRLPSECRISHSSQSTYFDAVALLFSLSFRKKNCASRSFLWVASIITLPLWD